MFFKKEKKKRDRKIKYLLSETLDQLFFNYQTEYFLILFCSLFPTYFSLSVLFFPCFLENFRREEKGDFRSEIKILLLRKLRSISK